MFEMTWTWINYDIFLSIELSLSKPDYPFTVKGHSINIPMWLSGRALRQRRNGCGLDSQGTHILMKMYNLNAIVSRFG